MTAGVPILTSTPAPGTREPEIAVERPPEVEVEVVVCPCCGGQEAKLEQSVLEPDEAAVRICPCGAEFSQPNPVRYFETAKQRIVSLSEARRARFRLLDSMDVSVMRNRLKVYEFLT